MTMIRPSLDVVYEICRGLPSDFMGLPPFNYVETSRSLSFRHQIIRWRPPDKILSLAPGFRVIEMKYKHFVVYQRFVKKLNIDIMYISFSL